MVSKMYECIILENGNFWKIIIFKFNSFFLDDNFSIIDVCDIYMIELIKIYVFINVICCKNNYLCVLF